MRRFFLSMQAHFVKWRRGAGETGMGMGATACEKGARVVARGTGPGGVGGRRVRNLVMQNARGVSASTDLRLGRSR